jgi:hypothetical protein
MAQQRHTDKPKAMKRFTATEQVKLKMIFRMLRL